MLSQNFKGRAVYICDSEEFIMSSMGNAATVSTHENYSSDLYAILDRAVKDSYAPSFSAMVVKDNNVVAKAAAGLASRSIDSGGSLGDISATTETVYDVSELTQLLVTVPLLMLMVQEGKLDLNHRVSRYLPSFNVLGKSTVTIGHLLSHTSGLPSQVSFYEALYSEHGQAALGLVSGKGARDFILHTIMRSGLKYPSESKQSYSEQNFILLGAIIELLTGMTLEKAAQKFIFKPLNLRSTSFIDISLLRRRGLQTRHEMIAATDVCPRRDKLAWGEVFDETSFVMGGISGHAGLFSTASDIAVLCAEFVAAAAGKSALLSRSVMRTFVEGGTFSIPTSYRFGFDSPSRENGMSESGLSPMSVGITSTTGCAAWIDLEQNLAIVLLANKIDSSRTNRKLLSVRHEIVRLAKSRV
jgi:CubicO group peptidase (beta-lactamase class C family)